MTLTVTHHTNPPFHAELELDARTLVRHIALAREALLDLEIVLDDRRHEAAIAVECVQVAERERNRAACHLANLIDLYGAGA